MKPDMLMQLSVILVIGLYGCIALVMGCEACLRRLSNIKDRAIYLVSRWLSGSADDSFSQKDHQFAHSPDQRNRRSRDSFDRWWQPLPLPPQTTRSLLASLPLPILGSDSQQHKGDSVVKSSIFRSSGSYTDRWSGVVSKFVLDGELQKDRDERDSRAKARSSMKRKSFGHFPSLTGKSKTCSPPKATILPQAQTRGNLRTPAEVQNQREGAILQLQSAFFIFDEAQTGSLAPDKVLSLLRCMLPEHAATFTERDAIDFIAESERNGQSATSLTFDGFVKGLVNLTRGGPNERMSDNQDYHPIDPDEAMDAADAVTVAVEARQSFVREQAMRDSMFEALRTASAGSPEGSDDGINSSPSA